MRLLPDVPPRLMATLSRVSASWKLKMALVPVTTICSGVVPEKVMPSSIETLALAALRSSGPARITPSSVPPA